MIAICISGRHFAEVYDYGDAYSKHLNDFCGRTTYQNDSEWTQMQKIAYNMLVKEVLGLTGSVR